MPVLLVWSRCLQPCSQRRCFPYGFMAPKEMKGFYIWFWRMWLHLKCSDLRLLANSRNIHSSIPVAALEIPVFFPLLIISTWNYGRTIIKKIKKNKLKKDMCDYCPEVYKIITIGIYPVFLKYHIKNASNKKISLVSQLLKILFLLCVLLFKIFEGCGGLEKTGDQCHTSS